MKIARILFIIALIFTLSSVFTYEILKNELNEIKFISREAYNIIPFFTLALRLTFGAFILGFIAFAWDEDFGEKEQRKRQVKELERRQERGLPPEIPYE